jgi:photosystem II stability/assembly factor-like uncharacterized protein
MKILRYLFLIVLSNFITTAFSQSFEPIGGPTGLTIHDICIGSDNEIYISVNDYGIFKSTDYGANWQPLMNGIPGTNSTPTELTPAPNGEVYCISDDIFYRLPAGSNTWESKFIPNLTRSARVSVNPEGNIFVSLKNLQIFSAESGNAPFEEITEIPDLYYFAELYSFGNNLNFGLHNYSDKLYRFDDDGSTYEDVTPDFQPYEDMRSLHQTPTGRLILTTVFKVWTSDDNAQTWQAIDVDPNVDYFPIYSGELAPNGDFYVLTGKGNYRSTDLANGFEKLTDTPYSYPINQSLSGITFTQDNHTFFYSYNRFFFHSPDGGQSWERIDDQFEYPTTHRMMESPDNQLFISTSKIDGLEVSENDGQSWEVFDYGGLNITDIAFHPNGDYFATSGWDVFHSTDKGQSWTDITPSSVYGQTSRVSVTPSGTILVSDREYLLRSEDLGQTWETQLFSDFNLNFPPAYHPTGDIYLNSSGHVWRSSDDGKNWVKIVQDIEPINEPTICPNGDVFIPAVIPNPLGTPAFEVIHLINNGNTPQNFNPPFWTFYDAKIHCDCEGKIFMASSREVYISEDSGETWNIIYDENDHIGNINFLFADSKNHLYIGFQNELPVRSENPTCDFVDDVLETNRDHIQVSISPNPMENVAQFNIQNDKSQEYKLHIFDLLGQKMKTSVFQSNSFSFHKDNLQSGVYFYRIEAQNQILTTGKLIIN